MSLLRSSTNEELQVRAEKQLRDEGNSFSLDVAFTVRAGFTILFGASGSGKTTLLDCIAGLAIPDNGRIALGETPMFDSSARVNVPSNRRSVGYLLQSLALFPHMTVQQNVHYGLSGVTAAERDRRSQRNSGIVSYCSAGAAAATRAFGGRAAARCTGTHAGYASAGLAARRTAYRARCRDQVADCCRPACLEPRAPDPDSLRHAPARRGICAGRARDCAGARKNCGPRLAE